MGSTTFLFALYFFLLRLLCVSADLRVSVIVAKVATGAPAPISWKRDSAADPTRFFLQSVVFGSQISPFNLIEVNTGTALQGSANVVSEFPGPHIILAFVPDTMQTISTSNIFEVTGLDAAGGSPTATGQVVTTTAFATVTQVVFRTDAASSSGNEAKRACQQQVIAPALLAAAFGIATAVLSFILLKRRKEARYSRSAYIEHQELKNNIQTTHHQPAWHPVRLEDQAGTRISGSGSGSNSYQYQYQTSPSLPNGQAPTFDTQEIGWGQENRQQRQSGVRNEVPSMPPPTYQWS